MAIVRFLFLSAWRVFWTLVVVAFLFGIFTKVYPITDGFGRIFLDLIAILLIFVIFRLFSRTPKQHR